MKHGFTLIEVLVTMAIVSILAGMLVPATWKWWEGQEVQTTVERLNALKTAMVGNKALMQNGIRTSYGYVGDFGELPVHGQLSTASLRTYIPGNSDTSIYTDAWGRRFTYTAEDTLPGYQGRYLSGKICSAGIDGIPGNKDDICVDLPVSEVAPTNRIQGNFVFTNATAAYQSALFEITFKNSNDPSGETKELSGCKTAFPNFTTLFSNATGPLNLPIGKVTIRAKGYAANTNCSGTATAESGTMDYFISDNTSKLLLNLPSIH